MRVQGTMYYNNLSLTKLLNMNGYFNLDDKNDKIHLNFDEFIEIVYDSIDNLVYNNLIEGTVNAKSTFYPVSTLRFSHVK